MNCCLFQMKYIFYQSTRLERHRCLNSSVNFLESVMMRGAGCYWWLVPLRFIKSKVNTGIYQDILELHVSFCWEALWRYWFHFPAWSLASAHSAKIITRCFFWPYYYYYYCVWLANQLTWPGLQRECVGYIVTVRWETPDSKRNTS